MSNPDYYKILGVSKTATDEEIKKQYRRLARKYHPDVSKLPNAENRFKEINEAYDVLKDREKRTNYDRFGNPDGNPFQGGFRPPPGGGRYSGGVGQGGFGQGGFGDIFDSFFRHAQPGDTRGSQFRQERQKPGNDTTVGISIDLEDAFHGAERNLRVKLPGITGSKTLKVKIPKGIKAGQKIRLPGMASSGGRQAGDLFLKVDFKPHPLFTVDGKDISLLVPISPWEAALGTTLSIPTLGGRVDMKIPANSQGGRKLRLKGRGLPGKEPGDQLIILQIATPPANNAKVKELYQQLAQASQFNPRTDF